MTLAGTRPARHVVHPATRQAVRGHSVAPIIGGLPAVEGSGLGYRHPLDDRGAGLADEQGSPPDQASEDTRSK